MMKLLDEFEMSEWAYSECYKGNNSQEMRNLITYPKWAYWYCRNIEDIEEMWRKIKTSTWAYMYCKTIKHRHEVWIFRRLNKVI